jgi:S1-C subfamily serine protease
MNKLRVVLFFALLGIVILIARHNSTLPARTESPTVRAPESQIASSKIAPDVPPPPAPSAAPVQSPKPIASADFQKASERIRPAIILLSVFDSTGKLSRNGTGFFVGDDGRFVTSKTVVEGAANAVVKTSDGGLYNVSGFLSEAGDLAVLKAEPKKPVPFIVLAKAEAPAKGTLVAVIPSPLNRHKSTSLEGTVSAEKIRSEWQLA